MRNAKGYCETQRIKFSFAPLDGGFTSAVYRIEPPDEAAWHAVVWLTAGSQHMVALSQTAAGELEFLCGESNVQGLLSAIRSNIESMGDLAAP